MIRNPSDRAIAANRYRVTLPFFVRNAAPMAWIRRG